MKKAILIPGNPAVSDYYLLWINELKSKTPNLEISYATSYVLFDKKLTGAEYEFAMYKHYESILLEKAKSDKVVIIAHSAGSHFALRLLERNPDYVEKLS
jgi:pimeloyl-ACP methyl ester carboxylesterase